METTLERAILLSKMPCGIRSESLLGQKSRARIHKIKRPDLYCFSSEGLTDSCFDLVNSSIVGPKTLKMILNSEKEISAKNPFFKLTKEEADIFENDVLESISIRSYCYDSYKDQVYIILSKMISNSKILQEPKKMVETYETLWRKHVNQEKYRENDSVRIQRAKDISGVFIKTFSFLVDKKDVDVTTAIEKSIAQVDVFLCENEKYDLNAVFAVSNFLFKHLGGYYAFLPLETNTVIALRTKLNILMSANQNKKIAAFYLQEILNDEDGLNIFSIKDMKRVAYLLNSNPEDFFRGKTLGKLICGDVIHKEVFDEDRLPLPQKKLLLNAMSEGKKSFVNLVMNNIDLYSKIRRTSYLLREEFPVNLATLTKADLEYLVKTQMSRSNNMLALEEGEKVTFDVLREVHLSKFDYAAEIYRALECKNSKKITILKALPRDVKDKDLDELIDRMTVSEFTLLLARKFEKMNFAQYKEQLHDIDGLSSVTILKYILNENQMLVNRDNIKTVSDIIFIEKSGLSVPLSKKQFNEQKRKLLFSSTEFNDMVKEMNLSDEFLLKYENEIFKFMERGLMTVYSKSRKNSHVVSTPQRLKNLNLITKAEMSGQLAKLKFYPMDYNKELGFNVDINQRDVWEKDTQTGDGEFRSVDVSDYYTTMTMGAYPVSTCQNYIDGFMADSLLSNFDLNKKIMKTMMNGRYSLRNIIRLTKFSTQDVSTSSLSFIDVEDEAFSTKIEDSGSLCIFMERPYSPLNYEQKKKALNSALQCGVEKSKQMNIDLIVVNEFYQALSDDDKKLYERIDAKIFISHSKNGMQYFDSIAGEQRNSSEGQYRDPTTSIYKLKR